MDHVFIYSHVISRHKISFRESKQEEQTEILWFLLTWNESTDLFIGTTYSKKLLLIISDTCKSLQLYKLTMIYSV